MGCPMPAASPVAGALLPAPCSVWDPRRRAPQELSLHARPLSHSHSSPPRLAPPAAQAPFTPRRSPARPSAAPLHPGGTFGVPAGRRCPRGPRVNRQGVGMGLHGSSARAGLRDFCTAARAWGAVPAVGGCSASWHRAIGRSASGDRGLWGAAPARHRVMGHSFTCSWGCGVQCQLGQGAVGAMPARKGLQSAVPAGVGGCGVQCQPGRHNGVQLQPGQRIMVCSASWGRGLWGSVPARAEGYGVQCHPGQAVMGFSTSQGRGLWGAVPPGAGGCGCSTSQAGAVGTPGWRRAHADRRCLVSPLRDVCAGLPCSGDTP